MSTVPARAVRMAGFRFGIDDLNFPAAETQRVFHSLGHARTSFCCDGHAVLDHLHHGGESLHFQRLNVRAFADPPQCITCSTILRAVSGRISRWHSGQFATASRGKSSFM